MSARHSPVLYFELLSSIRGIGLGPGTAGVRIDLHDSSGDYEASDIDGLEMHIHGNAQDLLGQIMAVGEQLNGGHFHPLADDDVNLGMIDSGGGKKREKRAAQRARSPLPPLKRLPAGCRSSTN